MESVRPASGAELLRHQDFVRRLAHELVRDAARADDLVQDAWVQALERPPRVAAAARAWFRTVVRNLAARGAREDGRRSQRERVVARDESQPSALEIGARLALQQELVRAVEALREPYRSAVFARYFEGLSPRTIAARQGVPLATIKTRLRRALELLREALDRSHGRHGWALALVHLVRPEQAVIPVAGPLMAAGLVLAGATVWVLRGSPERGGSETLAAFTPPPAATLAPAGTALIAPEAPTEPRVSLEEEETPERELVQPAAPDSAPQVPAADRPEQEPLRLHGRVLYPDGSGAQGASVAFGPFSAQCGRGGWFEIALDEDDARVSVRARLLRIQGSFEREDALVAWHDGWAPVIRRNFGLLVEKALESSPPSELAPVELVLPGPSLEIRGTLLDRSGAPAAGWRYSLLDGELVAKGDYRPFSAEDLASGTDSHRATGDDGGFAFRGLTPEKNYRIRAWNERTLEQVVSEPIPAGTLDVLLCAPNERWRERVDGVVVGLDGSPLADIRCRLSMAEYRIDGGTWMTTGQEVLTDALGRFAFVDVPPTDVFIRLNDGSGYGTQLDLAPEKDYRDLRIELVRAGAFVFESSAPGRGPDTVCALDEAGERLRLEVSLGEGRSRTTRDLAVPPEGTCRAIVSELARWLVLLRDGQELARLPLFIGHGEETRVRW